MSETDPKKEDEEPMAPDHLAPSAEGEGGEEGVELDEIDVRDLLRSALEPPPPKPKQETQLLKGVQRRLRVRSKGKFYADGWSTSRSPRSTYLVTSIFMLVLIAFVFLVLIPWSNSALP
jgi:hypothetical protein